MQLAHLAIVALALVASANAVALPPLDRTIGYKTILRTGMSAGKSPFRFGGLVNKVGQPVFEADESGHPTDEPLVSHNPDFSSLLETVGPFGAKKLFLLTQFESPQPTVQYLVELAQAPDGTLIPKSMKPVDWSAWGGVWVLCAGQRTPWGSHIGGEEYEPDARPFSEAADLAALKAKLGGGWGAVEDFMAYWDVYPADITFDLVKAKFFPYRYGHIVETRVDYKGTTTTIKWYTLGRAAFEMGYVMPDRKTVYMTDDGTNVGFYKFVANKAGDLSSGTLYAAKMTQSSDANGGTFGITWIQLASGTQSTLRKLADTTTFADIFETAAWVDGTGCPSGFKSVNEGGRAVQCLKLKAGAEVKAAFFETRRYANYLGATTEFSKWEGITYDSKRNALYTAMSSVRYGMLNASSTYDKGGNDNVRLPANNCGCVYKLPLDASLSATGMTSLVCGTPYVCADPNDPDNPCDTINKCILDGIASPDNVAYMPEYDTLIIGEDTSEHQNDMMWSYNITAGTLDRIFTTPYGSETTSPYWYSNINGNSYLMAVVQHPYAESDQDKVTEEGSTGPQGWVGYFNWRNVPKTTGLQFTPITASLTDDDKHLVRTTSKVTIYRGERTPLPLPKRGLLRRLF